MESVMQWKLMWKSKNLKGIISIAGYNTLGTSK
jgi:hypothetical protein